MNTAPPTVRRLAPTGDPITSIRDAYALERPRPSHRPWVSITMIASLDGTTAVDGVSGGLGNPNDVAVLGAMRSHADVILVGAGTARSEGYGPPKKPGQRIAVATNSGQVDLDSALFASGAGLLLAPDSAEIDESRVQVIRAGDTALDLPAAIAALDRALPDVHHINAEGGPRLNGTVLDADLADEISLTISPHLVGGPGDRLTVGADETLRRFTPDQLLVDEAGFVFSRWLRAR